MAASSACAGGLAILCLGLSLALAENPKEKNATEPQSLVLASRLRYPVALALADEGKLLLSANGRSGTVSIVDLAARRVIGEAQVARALSDIVSIPGIARDFLLATDPSADRLHVLVRAGAGIGVAQTLSVSSDPMSVCVTKSGKHCLVASRQSRRVSIFEIRHDPESSSLQLELAEEIALPFAPRLQIVTPDGERVIVADAFGGKLAVIHVERRISESIKTIPAVNIRGLAWSSDGMRLFVAHQTISALATTSIEDIHWGSLVTNTLRSLDYGSLIRVGGDPLRKSSSRFLGDIKDGAADPAGVTVLPDGTLVVALAGTGEVLIGSEGTSFLRRRSAGIRPTALLRCASGNETYVADTFGDSIGIFDKETVVPISLGPQPELSAADRGERQFFDARNAHDKWMSCHTCHTDGQSNDALTDTLGDGSYGAPKRIPALGGVGETGPWGWNGSARALSDQVRKSLETTMRLRSISDELVADLSEYLKSLPAPTTRGVMTDGNAAATERGREVFRTQQCGRCHAPPTYTSADVYDVGLKDEANNSTFNPPSLRGVGQRTRLFHDGRAANLFEVFEKYRHQLAAPLPDRDQADLLAFLRTL